MDSKSRAEHLLSNQISSCLGPEIRKCKCDRVKGENNAVSSTDSSDCPVGPRGSAFLRVHFYKHPAETLGLLLLRNRCPFRVPHLKEHSALLVIK